MVLESRMRLPDVDVVVVAVAQLNLALTKFRFKRRQIPSPCNIFLFDFYIGCNRIQPIPDEIYPLRFL